MFRGQPLMKLGGPEEIEEKNSKVLLVKLINFKDPGKKCKDPFPRKKIEGASLGKISLSKGLLE